MNESSDAGRNAYIKSNTHISVFKTLRNNEYIKKLFNNRIKAYDEMMSLNHNAV